jgi:protein O-GlcNAc transferase
LILPVHLDIEIPSEYRRAADLYQAGRLRDALDACLAHLQRTPAPYPPTLALLGQVLHDSGYLPEAVRELERSLALDDRQVGAWLAIAQVYAKLSRNEDSRSALNNAIAINPLNAAINAVSAGIALGAGDIASAAAHAQRATQLDPAHAPGWYNLALAAQWDGRVDDARRAIQRALDLEPGNASAAGLSAQLDADSGDLSAAATTLASALVRHPRNASLLMEQGWVAARAHDLPTAIGAYAKVLSIQPDNGSALSQSVFSKKQLVDWAGLDALQMRVGDGVAAGMALLTPFSFLSDPSTRAQQRRCAATWGAGFAVPGSAQRSPQDHALPLPAGKDGEHRRLRVGYLSGDFYQHPTSVLLAGVLERHDRARFEIFGYSTGHDDASPMRARIAAAVEHFVDFRDPRPERLAARIRDDRLDILVDLKGYTEGAATAALAMRPAPIQAHWVGYPGTLASPFIDYLVADKIVVPASHQPDYAEALAWLPHCYQPNDRSRLAASTPPRERLGLDQDSVVFAAFNAPWKFNAPVFDAWARVLASAPRSELWLLARSDDDPMIANVVRELGGRGVARPRIVFANRCAEPDYLALYRHADVFLDTWPYNAHTTASDALWMGCPVVTWLGETFAGRVGASLVGAAGVPELAAADVDGYVALAVALAADPPRRARLRDKLMHARDESALFDAMATARHIESAFATMVEQRRDGRRESFEVAATR